MIESHNSTSRTGPAPEPSALAPSTLALVERAAAELRRGLATLVAASDGSRALAIAGELATRERIEALVAWSGERPDIVLTHQRARTLKIRLYTPEVVRVALTGRLDAETVRSLADPEADLSHPLRGPFDARRDPVPAATLAAVKLAKIARLLPAVVAVPAPEGFRAEAHGVVEVAAADVLAYDESSARRLVRVTAAPVPLAGAEDAQIIAFRPPDGGPEHLAIMIGEPVPPGPVLARIHSECFTGDLLGSLKCDCGQQLRGAIEQIAREGAGILLYLAQEGRGIGLINKLRAYALQGQGFDTVEANERLGFEPDERLFLPAAEMLRQLGFSRVRLMTNNPDKVAALRQFGIEVVERVPHAFPSNEHNAFYLSTKRGKSGHLL